MPSWKIATNFWLVLLKGEQTNYSRYYWLFYLSLINCVALRQREPNPNKSVTHGDKKLTILKVVCADDKITQKFDLTALSFEPDKGLSIKIKV